MQEEAPVEERVEIAGTAISCIEDAVLEKSEERGSEAETRNGNVSEGKGEQCNEEEEAARAFASSCLNGGVCKNQEPNPVDCEMDAAVLKKPVVDDKNCCVKIEIVDETALVGFAKETKNVNFTQKNLNHNKSPRKMGKCGRTNTSEASENQKFLDVGSTEKGKKRVYSRKELEALRFVGLDWQRKRWTEVYCGLGPDVQEEYDGLVGSDNGPKFQPQKLQKKKKNKKKHAPVDFGRQFTNDSSSSILGEESSENAENEYACENPIDPNSGFHLEQDEGIEDDSDEDYSSIQKPALFVTGEPAFDSGPPEDGLEYLRRVRWEAAQIPKVKIAKVDRTKLNKEQTVYMPQIPDVAKCPVQLLPLKEWEDAFLADFSEFRMALSRFEISEAKVESSSSVVHEKDSSSKGFESFLLETVDNMPFAEDSSQSVHRCTPETCGNPCSSALANDKEGSDSLESPNSRLHASGASEKCPTLSTILQMDSVARVSALRKHIRLAESSSSLSWDDCLWLFALSAAIDSPLDADTSAAFRSLLRKCASLRAEKSEVDDEVAMLNILATISGRYFGQQEN